MPRKRNSENTGLPARWQHIHGAYYYQVPPGLESLWDGKRKFRLGKTLPEAYKAWSARIAPADGARTIGQLLDRYLIEVVPGKAAKSRTANMLHITKLHAVFGLLPLLPFKPQIIYQYITKRSKKERNEKGRMVGGRTIALREIETLSHVYTKAVEWGLIDKHPFKGEVRLEGEAARDRYVEDWEVIEMLSLTSRRKKGSVLMIVAYLRLKLLTGMSQGDLLRLQPARHFKDDGIHIQRHKTAKKTGKRTIYEWTPELREAVRMALEARPVDLAPWLFCNRRGQCYVNEENGEARGWRSMWQRFVERVMKETQITESFTEHDLRAKVGSDAESLERARALLSHADARTTQKIYRRKPERVRPLR